MDPHKWRALDSGGSHSVSARRAESAESGRVSLVDTRGSMFATMIVFCMMRGS
jgi:hypothetical protein